MKKIKNNQHDKAKLGKPKPYLAVQIIEYIPNAVVSERIVKKITDNITAMSVATGETVVGQAIAFNTFIQIIKGAAEVIIKNEKHQLKLGDGIIIPVNTKYSINAKEEFIMISTIAKSGYEDISVNNLN